MGKSSSFSSNTQLQVTFCPQEIRYLLEVSFCGISATSLSSEHTRPFSWTSSYSRLLQKLAQKLCLISAKRDIWNIGYMLTPDQNSKRPSQVWTRRSRWNPQPSPSSQFQSKARSDPPCDHISRLITAVVKRLVNIRAVFPGPYQNPVSFFNTVPEPLLISVFFLYQAQLDGENPGQAVPRKQNQDS